MPSLFEDWRNGALGAGSPLPPPAAPTATGLPDEAEAYRAALANLDAAQAPPTLLPTPAEPRGSLLADAAPFLIAAMHAYLPPTTAQGAGHTALNLGRVALEGYLGGRKTASERQFEDYQLRRREALAENARRQNNQSADVRNALTETNQAGSNLRAARRDYVTLSERDSPLFKFLPGRRIGDTIPKEQYNGALDAYNRPAPQSLADKVAETTATTEARLNAERADKNIGTKAVDTGTLQQYARIYALEGKLPTARLPAEQITDLTNMANAMFPEASLPLMRAKYAGLRKAESDLITTKAPLEAFTGTARPNIENMFNWLKKRGDLGSPLLNQPYLVFKEKVLGNADVPGFNAALAVVRPEVQRILQQAKLSGVSLHEGARKDYEAIMNGTASIPQLKSVFDAINTDFSNRAASIDATLADIERQINELGAPVPASGATSPAPAPAAPATVAAPAPIDTTAAPADTTRRMTRDERAEAELRALGIRTITTTTRNRTITRTR